MLLVTALGCEAKVTGKAAFFVSALAAWRNPKGNTMRVLNTIKEIEDAMADEIERPDYQAIALEYRRLLGIMGNVDGDEVISLVLTAFNSVSNPKHK